MKTHLNECEGIDLAKRKEVAINDIQKYITDPKNRIMMDSPMKDGHRVFHLLCCHSKIKIIIHGEKKHLGVSMYLVEHEIDNKSLSAEDLYNTAILKFKEAINDKKNKEIKFKAKILLFLYSL
jgi:predicted transglutaminase-like protease